jgi:hypothetical protein
VPASRKCPRSRHLPSIYMYIILTILCFRLMEKILDCSNLLSECMETHLEQAQNLLFSLPINPMEWSPTMDHCQSQQRYKRTPKKRGGSHGGSSRGGSHGGSSRGGILGRALSSSIGRSFSRGSSPSSVGGRKSSSGSVLRGLLGKFKEFFKNFHYKKQMTS